MSERSFDPGYVFEDGLLSEPRIWGCALSLAQIQANMSGGSPGKRPTCWGIILGIGRGVPDNQHVPRSAAGNHTTVQSGVIPLGQWALDTMMWNQTGLFAGAVNGLTANMLQVASNPLHIQPAPIVLGIYPEPGSFPFCGLLSSVAIGWGSAPSTGATGR